MADLLTLTEYKNLAGIPLSDVTYDAQLNTLLPAVSLAIRNFTGRNFEVGGPTEQRSFEYDGSGFLDIDDATAITAVSLSFPSSPTTPDMLLDGTYQWRAAPYNGPVYHYLIMSQLPYGLSTEMGFMYNLDVVGREGRLMVRPPVVKVTGTWGWPAIPADVKLAAEWTLEDWGAGAAGPTTPGVQAEAIEGFSRTFATGRPGDANSAARGLMAIPNRARDLLAVYTKVYV
jgi:hypothetical protein